jgi:hypothetical protein
MAVSISSVRLCLCSSKPVSIYDKPPQALSRADQRQGSSASIFKRGPIRDLPQICKRRSWPFCQPRSGRAWLPKRYLSSAFATWELRKMGVNIKVFGRAASLRGVPNLRGANVMGMDVRGAGALVIAGLGAVGQTVVGGLGHLDRGYDRVAEKLAACGANISRADDQ